MVQVANRGETGRAVEGAGRKTVDLAQDVANRSADTARRTFDASARGAKSVFNAENDLARLWLETASEQFRHNVETLQRLAAVRDWHEAVDVQGAYVRESLERTARLVEAYLDVTGAAAQRMLSAGQKEWRNAAA
jgi:hypothetical protein